MCGIFGIISSDQVETGRFDRLAEINKARGNLGFGCVAVGWGQPSRTKVIRWAEPYRSEMLSRLPEIGGNGALLGHIRAPTGRRSADLAEIHPFESDRFLLAHNGLLLNGDQFPSWRLNRSISVDSQIILGGIVDHYRANHDPLSAIEQTAAVLDGQQACWLWDKQAADLYLWRVMSPVYVERKSNGLTFSSIKTAAGTELLKEGVVYRLSSPTAALEAVGSFSFNSPYLLS